MENDKPETPSTDDDPLGALDTLDNISAISDIEARFAVDDVHTVHSSEIIEPLVDSDVIELDYDEDIPTRADGHRREQRRETYPPPRVDAKDVFYLTDERRPSLVLTAEDHFSISDVLKSPPLPKVQAPPLRDTIPPASIRPSQIPSIAPVAVSSESDEPEKLPIRRQGPGVYGSVVVVLAAAAAIITFWSRYEPPKTAETLHTTAGPAAAPIVNTTETVISAPDPVILELNVVEVIADTLPTGVPAAVKARPPEASDDSVPKALEPPRPPASDPLPFDRSAAAAAMNAAAILAKSCRTEGMPESSARVSVTLAPNGRVTTAVVDGDSLSSSAAGGCIARTFRTLRVEPFAGPPVTVHKTFRF